MPKLSAKRQITIPAGQCEELGIQPGDEIDSFIVDGRITLIKRHKGAAEGFLKHVKTKQDISDDDSLQSGL
ncbi:AbrB/MazE/SpoVT family DNA-binding domain-containing protein [Endozoicomonas sp. ALD040]|uniref:AbrB/MazE/SpoVT family DNA-binding domain-containing protein n=1 Tax=unclassified Endozoicomonas TaxID=2644528 RepID=UPI003BAE2974